MHGAFEVLFKERELQDSLDEVSDNLRKWRKVILEFNQYCTTKARPPFRLPLSLPCTLLLPGESHENPEGMFGASPDAIPSFHVTMSTHLH